MIIIYPSLHIDSLQMRPHHEYSLPFIISRNKQANQSQIESHFILTNVKWKLNESKKQQKLTEYALIVLSKYCRTYMVQISSIVGIDLYDLSIGLFDDVEALQLINKKQLISLSDGTTEHQYLPTISNTFRNHITEIQSELSFPYTIQPTINTQNNEQPSIKLQHHQNQQMQKTWKTDEAQKIQYNCQHSIKDSENQWKINKIWAFGIPKEFEIEQIKSSLKKFKLEPTQCRWKNKEHMQYLEIELSHQISKSSVYYLGLQIEGYPYVALPVTEQNKITRQLSRYTVEIIVREVEDDQAEFMECMYQIGGVNIMLRSPIKQKKQYRYIVVFNNVDNAELACTVAKNLRNCTANHKQYELKLGRLCKFYTFTELMKQHFFSI